MNKDLYYGVQNLKLAKEALNKLDKSEFKDNGFDEIAINFCLTTISNACSFLESLVETQHNDNTTH